MNDPIPSTSDQIRLERLRERLPAPRPDWTRRPLRVVPVIVAINVVVFLLWQMAARDANVLRYMNANFVVSTDLLRDGAFWTLLTSVFSHQAIWHIFVNMFVLWSFGSVMERLLGSRTFAGFYLASGIFASAAHCAVSAVMDRGQNGALGASGAVSAVLLAYALTFPRSKILLFGVVPMPALGGAMLFVGLDIWGLIAQGQGGGLPIGHGAHLGGALAGAVFWWLRLRGRVQPRPVAAAPSHRSLGLGPDEIHEFDRLRRKLAAEGPSALSDEERAFLRSVRDRALN